MIPMSRREVQTVRQDLTHVHCYTAPCVTLHHGISAEKLVLIGTNRTIVSPVAAFLLQCKVEPLHDVINGGSSANWEVPNLAPLFTRTQIVDLSSHNSTSAHSGYLSGSEPRLQVHFGGTRQRAVDFCVCYCTWEEKKIVDNAFLNS